MSSITLMILSGVALLFGYCLYYLVTDKVANKEKKTKYGHVYINIHNALWFMIPVSLTVLFSLYYFNSSFKYLEYGGFIILLIIVLLLASLSFVRYKVKEVE